MFSVGVADEEPLCCERAERNGVEIHPWAEVSKQTISTITDKVMDGMAEWQNRPLDRVCPVLFVDAINVKIRVLSTIL